VITLVGLRGTALLSIAAVVSGCQGATEAAQEEPQFADSAGITPLQGAIASR
jgi:hypothetical protein